jgi:Mn2+/Fe2+ NRAMP family transporter
LGPTLITASVVIGPGTITVASKLGAGQGYGLLWVVLFSAGFMWLFATMSVRVALTSGRSLPGAVADAYGRPAAVLMGLLAFTVTTAFQLSNYLACATALNAVTGISEGIWISVVASGGMVFLVARHLYRFAERAMAILVFAMVVSFFANMAAARPDWPNVAAGFVPSMWEPGTGGLVIAMFATTFSVIAALYHGTLALQKGWTTRDLRISRQEAAIGIGLLATITCVIMITAGTALRGLEVNSAAVLAEQFRPTLGPLAVWMFSLGFLAAGFSSVIVNPMVGGGLLSDGLGLGANTNEKWPRLMTAIGMITGVITAYVTLRSGSALEGIVLAQRATIVAVPFCAIMLVLVANNPRIMGEARNRWTTNIVAGFAITLLVAINVIRLLG